MHSVGAGYRAAVEGTNSAVGTCLASAANRSSPGHTLGREGVCMHTLGASNPSSTRAGTSFTLSAIKFLGPAVLGPVCSPCALGNPPHYAQLRSVAYSVQTVQSVRLCVAVCVATAHTTRAQVCPTRCISLSQERLRLVNEVLCVPLCSSSLTFARLMLQVILSNSSERSRGTVVANPTPQATPAAGSGHRDGGSGSRTEWAFSNGQRAAPGHTGGSMTPATPIGTVRGLCRTAGRRRWSVRGQASSQRNRCYCHRN